MKKRIIALLVPLIMLSVVLVPQTALAKPTKPQGTFNAISWLQWSGSTVSGAQTQFYIDNPSISAGNYWYRQIYLLSGSTVVVLGIVKQGAGNTAICPGGAGLWSFITPPAGVNFCRAIPADDINDTVLFSLWRDQNSGDMEFLTTSDHDDMMCQPGPCSYTANVPASFSSIKLQEAIHETFTGSKVWGGMWTINQWRANGGGYTWSDQTQPSRGSCPGANGCPHTSNPPQFYWFKYPSELGLGGSLDSCVYDTGSICFFRS